MQFIGVYVMYTVAYIAHWLDYTHHFYTALFSTSEQTHGAE